MSSQWPVVLSLPAAVSIIFPNAPAAAGSGGTPSIGAMRPNPRRPITGRRRPPQARATCGSVLAPKSPYRSASGASPTPQLSSTITTTRLNGGIDRAGPRCSRYRSSPSRSHAA